MKSIKKYKKHCNKIAQKFCKKQDIDAENSWWFSSKIGQILICGDTITFNLTDIILDLETNQPKGFIIEWFVYNSNNYFKGLPDLNYKSYINGHRH